MEPVGACLHVATREGQERLRIYIHSYETIPIAMSSIIAVTERNTKYRGALFNLQATLPRSDQHFTTRARGLRLLSILIEATSLIS